MAHPSALVSCSQFACFYLVWQSVEVVAAFIDQIKRVNPAINAMCNARFEDALAEARLADEILQGQR